MAVESWIMRKFIVYTHWQIFKLLKIRLLGGGGYRVWMAGKRQEHKICTELKTRGNRQYVKIGKGGIY